MDGRTNWNTFLRMRSFCGPTAHNDLKFRKLCIFKIKKNYLSLIRWLGLKESCFIFSNLRSLFSYLQLYFRPSFVTLFGVFHPNRAFFNHMKTLPLPVKGCKFWPILGTHGHWTVSDLNRATPIVTRDNRLFGHLRGHVTLTTVAESLNITSYYLF